MDEKAEQSPPVSVVALRAESYSADCTIVISLRTKYSAAERKYAIPLACIQDLIVDLRRLSAAEPPTDRPATKIEPPLPLESPSAAE